MAEERSLEGWEPEVDDSLPLAEVIDRAFDYRGDVTVVTADGTEMVGYLFNRDRDVREPFIQIFDRSGSGPHTIPYARIRTIRFTGKDTAAGNSYSAWLERRAASGARATPVEGA
ncbi:MAG: hypothetical protein HY727_17120 [Candidatus Rokubacteria bacterium]|nr:hypothetical protein [Candidatus Rokubacteria bacterium]